MLQLKVFIDVYGRVGLAKKFPDDEKHCGINDMLYELVNEEFYGDRYGYLTPGFYLANFEIYESGDYFNGENYLQIHSIVSISKINNNKNKYL
jgi:hypothetical protein